MTLGRGRQAMRRRDCPEPDTRLAVSWIAPIRYMLRLRQCALVLLLIQARFGAFLRAGAQGLVCEAEGLHGQGYHVIDVRAGVHHGEREPAGQNRAPW